MLNLKLNYRHKLFAAVAIIAHFTSGSALSAPSMGFSVLHAFDDPATTLGATRPSSLLQGNDGNLYGGASVPSSRDTGAIFKIDLTQSPANYSEYFRFQDGIASASPVNQFVFPTHVTQARNGSFYVSGLGFGMLAGPESLYQITSISPPEAKLLSSFPTWMSDATGSHRLIEGRSGVFYTTTRTGGDFLFLPKEGFPSGGTLIQIDTSVADPNNTLAATNVLHKFDFINGANPQGGLIKWRHNLYGTTCRSGNDINGEITPNENGVIYRYNLKAPSAAFSVLHRFDGIRGACPNGELLKARNNKLYGTTSMGGKYNNGVIFELDLNGIRPRYRVLHHFDGLHGAHPKETLVQSSRDGSIYGITYDGGSFDKGLVFKLYSSRCGAKYSVIHEFDGLTSGENPKDLLFGKDGDLYGLANGGLMGGGLVYHIELHHNYYRLWDK